MLSLWNEELHLAEELVVGEHECLALLTKTFKRQLIDASFLFLAAFVTAANHVRQCLILTLISQLALCIPGIVAIFLILCIVALVTENFQVQAKRLEALDIVTMHPGEVSQQFEP